MKKLVITLFMIVVAGTAMAQESFSSLEERMTGKEFMQTGLSKLSEEELAALNDWLRKHSVATLDAPRRGVASVAGGAPGGAVEDRRGLSDDNDKDHIVSRVVGEFRGWDGDTIFKLENGMVWKQAQSDRFVTRKMENPVVTIKPSMFGAWRLEVEGYNKSVKVERIQ
ncbi:MAG: hypothetical protein R3348_07910 [Xanthomonadales bacterium]|nr:hypothetical protein [Xanthomonadales bacterium]